MHVSIFIRLQMLSIVIMDVLMFIKLPSLYILANVSLQFLCMQILALIM